MNCLKAIVLCIGTVTLSGVLAMQAVTNVLENDQPALAASVSPLNGFALERVALARFTDKDGASLTPLAEQALAREPLSPAAWTILALAQQNGDKKDAILLAASKISRRTLLLQSNLLLLHASRDDFANNIAVLNQMLAVHPEQKETMFPILIEALKDERSVLQFVKVLNENPPWSDSFMQSASQDSDALPNLVRVRMGLSDKVMVEPHADNAIIGALIKAGQIEAATVLYRSISDSSAGATHSSAGKFQSVDWTTKIPPFDWKLTNGSDVRAQVIEEPERLEFFVRSGKAGILAERLLSVPASFTMELKHGVSPIEQLEDVRIELQCEKTKFKFFDRPLTVSPTQYSIGPIPVGCELVRLSLSARAWSDKADLSGEIYSIKIKSR